MTVRGAISVVGTDAVTGEPGRWEIADGVFVEAAGRDAVRLTGFVLPGLVDAHCHIGYSAAGTVDLAEAARQARTALGTGVLAVRDCGSPLDTRPLVGRDDLPVLIRAGRHVARERRYLRDLGVELDDPADLPAEVARQLAYGDGWVKLVADWIDRRVGDLTPLWPDHALAAAVGVAHAAGARVTAHVFGEDALPGLLAAGVDCIEHGTGLTGDTIEQLRARQVRLVPTRINIANFPVFADAAHRFPAYAKHMRDLHRRSTDTLRSAVAAGVEVHAGTDAGGFVEHGRIVDEVVALAEVLPPRAAMAAASTRARRWLGLSSFEPGTSGDLVVYPADPALDLGVLRAPTAVVRAGRIVGGVLAGRG